MIRVLFVCHGNICRSTMAQYVLQDMVNKMDLTASFHIDSAATSREEIGNPVHHGTRRKLKEVGIPCGDHRARQCRSFLISRREKGRILPIRGIRGILTRHTET